MSIHYTQLRSPREWKSTIGVSKEEFTEISKIYGKSYEKYYGYSIEVPKDSTLLLKSYEESIFFVLFELKQGLNFDTLGFVFGTDGANAHRQFTNMLRILEISLSANDFMPKRKIKTLQEFSNYVSKEEELIIDVSEESIERPKDKVQQKAHYSGKKNSIR